MTTLATYFSEWLADRRAFGHISQSSECAYERLVAPALAHVGSCKITKVSAPLLKQAMRDMRKHSSETRVRDAFIQIRKCLEAAHKDGTIKAIPAIELPRPKRKTKDTTLTKDQLQALLKASKEWGQLGLIVRFAMATGCRRGEICALQWQDVSLEDRIVKIRRNIGLIGRVPVVGAPKTAASKRTIALPESLCGELTQIESHPTEWVFGKPDGNVRNPNDLTRAVGMRLAEIGLGAFTLHDLRHAHATYLLQQQQPLKAVSQRLGHSNVQITLSTYAHVMPGDDQKLAHEMNGIF